MLLYSFKTTDELQKVYLKRYFGEKSKDWKGVKDNKNLIQLLYLIKAESK